MIKNPFKSHGERFYSPCGSKTRIDYVLKVEPDGNKHLVESGVTDVYAKIQSHEQECSIDYILKRYAAGDESVLAKQQGVYVDSRLFPTDLITATEAVRKAELIYNSLPADMRANYNGFDGFIRSIGIDDGLNKFFSSLNNYEGKLDNEQITE